MYKAFIIQLEDRIVLYETFYLYLILRDCF